MSYFASRTKVKVFIGSLWLLMSLNVCMGQSHGTKPDKKARPDLNGTWVLDKSRSSLDSEMKKKVVDYVLIIIHREPEIRMAKKYKESGREYSDEIVYYTDGRPEFSTAKGPRSPEPVTRWQGNKLVRTVSARLRDNPSVFARKVPSGPQTSPPLEVVTTEEWTLSTDGKTLTRTIATSGVVMSRVKYVFVRG